MKALAIEELIQMDNKYTVIVHQYGDPIIRRSFSEICDELIYFYYMYDSPQYGVRLYVNGSPVRYYKIEKMLGKSPYPSHYLSNKEDDFCRNANHYYRSYKLNLQEELV